MASSTRPVADGARPSHRVLLAVTAVAAAACTLLAACSSSSKSGGGSSSAAADAPSSSSSGASSSGSSGGSGIVAAAQAAVAQGYQGTYRPPAPGPAAVKGKSVYVITCANFSLGCYTPALAIQTAAQTLGWKVTIVDGKLTPAGFTAGIQQAIAAKPDGIITIGIDCTAAKAAYSQAKAAHIPTVGIYTIDCNDPAEASGPSQLSALVDAGTGQDAAAWFEQWGKLHADYLIAKTNGQARVIQFAQEGFTDIDYIDQGFEAEMAKCTSCKIVNKTTFTPADAAGPGVVSKVSSTLIAHASDANSIFFDNDSDLGSALPSLKANPHPSWTLVGSEGLPTTLSQVGSTVTGLITYPASWLGWCGAYTLNEVFANHPVTDCGLGFQIVDADHSKPASGATTVTPSVDFESIMKSQWTS